MAPRPRSLAPPTTLRAPATFASRSASAAARSKDTVAAACTTASRSRSACATAPASVMSPTAISTSRALRNRRSAFSRLRASTRTSWPSATRRRAVWYPMKPVAPVTSARIGRRSAPRRRDGGPAIGPWLRRLELVGERQQRRLAAPPRRELGADRKPRRAPAERDGHRRRARHVVHGGVADVADAALPQRLEGDVGGEAPERRRRAREHRREPDIHPLEEGVDRALHPREGLARRLERSQRLLLELGGEPERPGLEELHLAPVAARRELSLELRGALRPDGEEVLDERLARDRGPDLRHLVTEPRAEHP